MRYELRFQDPSADDAEYLYEQIVRELEADYTTSFEGIFAFATRQGVGSLLEDPDFEAFLNRGGKCRLVVGLDAITDVRTLELLEALRKRHEALDVSVFHNDVADLFHPKVARFLHDDGGQTVIVGSGNLTPGGLRRNIEAYAIIAISRQELRDQESPDAWEDFLHRHAERIRAIDDDALEAARANRVVRRKRALKEIEPEEELAEAEVAAEEALAEDLPVPEPILNDEQRMLLAQVPRAGGRWNQVHFNEATIREHFRMEPNSPHRAFLYEVQRDGSLGQVESRKCVLSRHNMNHKIEFAAHHGDDYPESGPPILVLRQIAHHVHRYQMLFPGDDGYGDISAFLGDQPVLGRGPTRRAIIAAGDVKAAWPDCPV